MFDEEKACSVSGNFLVIQFRRELQASIGKSPQRRVLLRPVLF